MNTTALELRHLGVIIETGCTRRWGLLIESHSMSFVALVSCSPLVQWMRISIARIFLFSHPMVNGCKQTMRTRLKAGSKCTHFNFFPTLTGIAASLPSLIQAKHMVPIRRTSMVVSTFSFPNSYVRSRVVSGNFRLLLPYWIRMRVKSRALSVKVHYLDSTFLLQWNSTGLRFQTF